MPPDLQLPHLCSDHPERVSQVRVISFTSYGRLVGLLNC
jgi:hypothetical protein